MVIVGQGFIQDILLGECHPPEKFWILDPLRLILMIKKYVLLLLLCNQAEYTCICPPIEQLYSCVVVVNINALL